MSNKPESIAAACNLVTAALSVAMERLELNDYAGEEAGPMETVADGEAAFRNVIAPAMGAAFGPAPSMLHTLRDAAAWLRGDLDIPEGELLARIDAAVAAGGGAIGGTAGAIGETEPETRLCPSCGSDDVVKDACARWNPAAREWEISSLYDSETCCACDAEGDFLTTRKG